MAKIYDVTVPTHPGIPVWPGGPSFKSIQTDTIPAGAICNVTDIEMCVHTGTHVDAPLHFSDGGRSIDQIKIDQLVGDCIVADLGGRNEITSTDLQSLNLPSETRKLILKTDNSALWSDLSHPFFEDYCALTPDAAQWVAQSGIHLLGIDYLSVSLYKDPPEIVHRILCDADMVMIEGLNLTEIVPGDYRVTCLPFNIVGADGAPARVILEG